MTVIHQPTELSHEHPLAAKPVPPAFNLTNLSCAKIGNRIPTRLARDQRVAGEEI